MTVDVLVAEIGSTTTVLNAFNHIHTDNPQFIGQGQSPTTVLEGDVNIGILNALEILKKNLKLDELNYKEMFATSSAAGGLKMSVHGLVYDMTVKAAREAALGAGANLSFTTAGKLTPHDIKRILKLQPNIILLAGGVDYGDKEVVLYNAELIANLSLKVPVIYAGNCACQDDVIDFFEEQGKRELLYVVSNVYPKIDKLDVEPVRKIIHNVFEEHIIHAVGMNKVKDLVTGSILPTPGSVMEISKILKEEIGDLITIDVGGATTDVHSVTEGSENINKILIHPEPTAKRTVEGDLGVFVNKDNIISILSKEKIIKQLQNTQEELESLIENYKPIPQSLKEKQLVTILTQEAVQIAIRRHAGTLSNSFSGNQNKVAYGKDLTAVQWIIGTGGALTRLEEGRNILTNICEDNGRYLFPTTSANILLDHDYIMASLGILSKKYKTATIILMKKSLRI